MISEVVRKFPQTVSVFASHGMECVGCSVAQFETIDQGARAHNINVAILIRDLNKVVLKGV